MATLSSERKNKAKKYRMIICIFISIVGTLVIPYLASWLDQFFLYRMDFSKVDIRYIGSFENVLKNENPRKIFWILFCVLIVLVVVIATSSWDTIGRTETMMVTDKISIPVAVGEGQHGTSRFMNEDEKKEEYTIIKYDVEKHEIKKHSGKQNYGLVLAMNKNGKYETIICESDDKHSLIIGATRSGKTRRLIYQTIWLRAKAGKSMVINDPKGELYLCSNKYLKEEGYNVIDIDFRSPLKSKRYNYMALVNKAVAENDIAKAIDYTWDLVSVMVGTPKGEPLWTNGESAVIAASILAVALEAPKQYHNLTNVYYFLSNMCKVDEEGEMPITRYFKTLPDEHPARGVFAVAEISPDRTRGSFFGSALATLRLFTNYNIADMTSTMDFDLESIGKEKTAVFIIIPDEKTTLYSLVSLMVNQIYVTLVEVANEYGGRLPVDVEFELDEFGNCPPIPSFGSMLSVGAGRGLRFNIVLQDFQQLEKQYEKDFQNIKGNCQNWVYLKTPTLKTLEEISKKTGTYTVQVNSVNSSVSGEHYKKVSFSDNANMSSRALLMPHEVERIERPYSLVLTSGKYPAIMYSPDLSKYNANKEMGLGDEEHNKKLRMEREQERISRNRQPMDLWKIWKDYTYEEDEEENAEDEQEERVSFLN